MKTATKIAFPSRRRPAGGGRHEQVFLRPAWLYPARRMSAAERDQHEHEGEREVTGAARATRNSRRHEEQGGQRALGGDPLEVRDQGRD